MCGIVGYIGSRQATGFLIEGLRRLEYRGYDSSGVATVMPGSNIGIVKTAGRIGLLENQLNASPLSGTIGIGHTRWATHGTATDENAHPHTSSDGCVSIVHNGVIENFRALKDRLTADGVAFASDTDSEVIAQLIAHQLQNQTVENRNGQGAGDEYDHLVQVVQAALAQLQGTYGLTVLFRDYPSVLIAARLGSPLVIGVGEGEHFIASDASPLVGHTEKIVYMSEHELAVVTADSLRIVHRDQGSVQHRVQVLEMDEIDVGLDGYPHHMLKEIFEQPESLRNAMRGRLNLDDATAVFGGLNLTPQELRSVNRIVLTACGTSWHAAMVGEYIIEEFARIPVEVEYASELRYRNPPNTAVASSRFSRPRIALRKDSGCSKISLSMWCG